MEITELNETEEVVLVGLMREIVQADGEYTDAERKAVEVVRAELGPERFERAIERARDQLRSRADLKSLAQGIEREEVRELIYRVLEKVAEIDGVAPEEEKPLAWLSAWWKVE
jgi:hypothetical protein